MNIGIIGLGKLGGLHLKFYKENKQVKKIYLVDIDKEKLKLYNDLPAFDNYRCLENKVDAVSIATPTHTHFEIASFFLKKKIPTLLEKPISQNPLEAKKLTHLASLKKTLLFIGHVERYNQAYRKIKNLIKNPLFIECHRISHYPYRSLDISVVKDIMIHDLDILTHLIKEKITRIEAKGVCVLSSHVDIANARLKFSNGCVANITASRISDKKERKLRIFTSSCYISLDYAQQKAEIYRKKHQKIEKKVIQSQGEPLKEEINEFLRLAKKNTFSRQYFSSAAEAIKIASRIEKIIAADLGKLSF